MVCDRFAQAGSSFSGVAGARDEIIFLVVFGDAREAYVGAEAQQFPQRFVGDLLLLTEAGLDLRDLFRRQRDLVASDQKS